jgi:hypothetical protein
MKVLLGSFTEDIGTVETSPAGLVYGSPDPEHTRAIVESERTWTDRAHVQHVLGDEELVRSLPYRLQGLIVWAVAVDEVTGLTIDQPAYDPWGDVWHFGKKTQAPPPLPPILPISEEDRARRQREQEWKQRAAAWVAKVKERASGRQRHQQPQPGQKG